MKIAFASDDEKTIAGHFGRTRGFVIFDIEDKEIKKQEYRINTFTGHARGIKDSQHNHNWHSPVLEAMKDCHVIVTQGMGVSMYNYLIQAKIQVFITKMSDIKSALNSYLQDELDNNLHFECGHKHS
ncbi:MAG: iron-molybdenum cofactor biosynthesis protein [Candidatus Latescibacteria bacterium]|nr:iron-molybdenum cofactor biosynthesis protein [Candidatus Latescibacterota bacterium]